jgi:hypothetical protein
MREATERLSLGPMTVGENLGDEHPDHGALSHGVSGDEGKDARRNDGVVSREEGPRGEAERRDVAQRSDEQQRAPPDSVDQPEADEREDEVGEPDADRLQERRLGTQSGHLEDARREVEDRVDSGELVEEGDEKREKDGRAQPHRPEPSRRVAAEGRLRNLVRLACEGVLRPPGMNQAEDREARGPIQLPANQPPGALWDDETESCVQQGGERRDAEHPTPRVVADAGEPGVGEECDQDAEDNVELEHAGETSTLLGRRNLRDVERRNDGRDPDAEPTDESRDDERIDVLRQSRPHRGHEVEDPDPEQRRAAAEPVGRPAPDHRPDHRAVEGRRHRDAVQTRAQVPERLDRLLGSGNDDRVESEQKPCQGGCRRPDHEA